MHNHNDTLTQTHISRRCTAALDDPGAFRPALSGFSSLLQDPSVAAAAVSAAGPGAAALDRLPPAPRGVVPAASFACEVRM